MLKIINSLSEYEKLYREYVIRKKTSGFTNFYVSKSAVPEYIAHGKIQYDIMGDTLFFLVDQENFYRLYFCGLTNDIRRLPTADKKICCDIYEQRKNDAKSAFIHNLLLNNGFYCRQEYEQVRLCFGFLHNLSDRYLEKHIKKLSRASITMKTVSSGEKNAVEKLITDNIGEYNGFSIEDDDWDEQVKNENVVGLYHDERLIAVHYITPKATRVVVTSKYRGKNLSVLLRMYYASQKRWEDSTQKQYDWVGVDNISSKKAFDKLLAIYTGKVKYRYIFQSKE